MPKRSTLRLTKRIVDGLRADDKDAIFWDRDLLGFGVRVHVTGRKLYIVQSRGPAGLKRVTLGRVGTGTIEDRRREAALVIDRIKRGENPKPSKPPPPPTVADLSELVLKNYVETRCKPRTAKNYRVSIRNHILPALGTKALRDVGPEDLTALHHKLRATPAAANRAVEMLFRIYRAAEERETIPEGSNPCGQVAMNRQRRHERFLTDEEFRRLGRVLDEAEERGGAEAHAAAAIHLLMLTGCRKSEILTLRWADVDPEAGELRLADAKSGPRTVQLPPAVVRRPTVTPLCHVKSTI